MLQMLAHPANTGSAAGSAPSNQMRPLPWSDANSRRVGMLPVSRRLLSVLLLLLAVLAAAPQPVTALLDVVLDFKPGVYNPSLAVYQGSGWLVARSTQLKWDITALKWILNRAYLCQVNLTDWSTVRCHDFDPWRGAYGAQCRWGSPTWRVPWEAWGVDDTKLFRWPGRGLWAITGRSAEFGSWSDSMLLLLYIFQVTRWHPST
eukprot:GHRR01020455.1.p1 GENE.GHRR01020455.1~~GHRR01020455.1.p1  ORF type:complete len:204 (+),score=47.20 GHRR01020455.1:1289-1900(+)